MKYQMFDPLRPEEYAALEADIKKRGVLIPVEKDENGDILDGHHRQEIADRLGLPCPSVVRSFASETEKREHVVKTNLARRHLDPLQWGRAFTRLLEDRGVKNGQGSRNDKKGTSATVAEVAAECGVSERTARSRVEQAHKYDTLPAAEKQAVDQGTKTIHKAARDVDRRKKLEEAAAARPRRRQKPSWEIRHGDCLEQLDALRPESIPLAFADSPYNEGVDYGGGTKADRLPEAEFIAWCGRWIAGVHRVLTPDGSFWLLISSNFADYLGLELRKAGFKRRAWIVWYETFGVCNSSLSGFNRCVRHLLYCVKDPKRYAWLPEAVMRPSDRQTEYHDKRANPDGKVQDDAWEINLDDLLEISRVNGTAAERMPEYPTQLPVELLRRVIGCSSNPDDLILDPFCGSGTTGAAALELGRRFLGIERESRWVELASLRLQALS